MSRLDTLMRWFCRVNRRVSRTLLLLGILFLANCTALNTARNSDENDPAASEGTAGQVAEFPSGDPDTGEPGAAADRAAGEPGSEAGTPEVVITESGTAESGEAAGAPAFAEGETAADDTAEPEHPAELPPERSPEEIQKAADDAILEMDIRTSTLIELAAWCRSLGLSEGGDRDALAGRLRQHYALPAPEEGQTGTESKNKTIIIESARSTEYFTLEMVDEEYARLRGDVVISLKDGEAVHRIRAWEILYNRTRNIMSASGGVEYVKEEGDTRETYRGESITVNIDNWDSVFMDSVSERSLSGDETTYRFAGSLITRSDEDVTILTQATVSNGADDNAYWSISASKIWLLPGSDWAILNAVLKVGEVPVLYIPAFFFPADELVFHPVVGVRSREGPFVQTTTYIFGRPKASAASESSITRILGANSDNEQVREGLFLRSTSAKSQDPNDTRLSVLFDWYANLGGYLGTEFSLPKIGLFKSMDLSLGLGFTYNVYSVQGTYTPFPNADGVYEWNSAPFFSGTLPFRYRLNTTGSLSGAYGSFSWSLPFYSDPYVNRDLLNRSEAMDWFGMVQQGNNAADTTDTTTSVLGSYEWHLNGSVTPKISVLAPYVSSLTISNISSTLSFQKKTTTDPAVRSVDPTREFYFPDKFTIFSVATSIQGTPLTLGNSQTAQQAADKPEAGDDPLGGLGTPRSPWEKAAEAAGVRETSQEPYRLAPPALNQRFELPRQNGLRFTIDYRLDPEAASEMQFAKNNWHTVDDINWGEISSIKSSLKTGGSVTFTLTDPNTSFFNIALRAFGNASWQGYALQNEEAAEFDTQAERDAATQRVNAETFFTTSAETIATLRPFYWDTVWGNTNIQYTLRGLLAKSVYNNSVADPLWNYEYGGWNIDKLDAHQMALNLSASVMDKVQNLSLTADLPPEHTSILADATFRIWITETNVRERILRPFEEEERKFEPLSFTETLRFAPNYSALASFVYDPELNSFTNLTSSLTLSAFRLSYSMVRSRTYSLSDAGIWVLSPEGTEVFNPRDFRFDFAKTFKQEKLWNDRLSFSVNVNTNFIFDFQRYTNTRLGFSFGFTLGITKFLDLSLSTSSENAAMFRYFQDLFDLPAPIPGEKNIFIDLLNSFRFDNDILRRSSGFKLKTFELKLTHHMGDWDLKVTWALSPYLDQTNFPYQYKFNNDISFVIQWVPITEIKTEILYNKDVITHK
ncbi:hypothetical protein FACS189483_01890 [Spirochaetia bacterium]|nr:hypothetical protein FACS189483_01890 [Spirochaetia bacterium]